MAKRKLILDVDTGTDDAVAVMLAALHPALDLVACTTVNGNVEVAHGTDNTLRVLDHIGRRDVPVYEGLARPLVRPDFPVPRTVDDRAGKFHGKTLPLPPTARAKAAQGAVEFLIETYRQATDEITLVPVAPLTNIAAALTLDPKLTERVPEVVIMGGGHAIGNVTPSAEFNIWADPEAAAIVFGAGFRKITLVPLDATHRALVSRADCDRLRGLGTPAGEAAAECIGHRIVAHDAAQQMATPGTTPVHDAVCVAYLVEPPVIATRKLHVAVETAGALTVGRTVIDTQFRGSGLPQCDVAFDSDPARFVDLLVRTFAA
ncbi:nucleoside hydrolase [Desertibaculum subflavum]|uniref:nucleoside hydrolase n=1 Tax=Desertibaculum subflavum TaxID=2268458 RepID=UPI000E665452